MTTSEGDRSTEARQAYERYVAERGRVEQGERSWSSLAEEFFTEDVVFIDPAWGRSEGRAAVADFMDRSMVGLEDWTFPEEWIMVDDDRVVSFWWNRLPGTDDAGRPYQAPGVSIMRYAGNGRFDHELDILNMAEVFEIMTASGWTPSGEMNLPPKEPIRDTTPPPR